MTCSNSYESQGIPSFDVSGPFYHPGDEPGICCKITGYHCPTGGNDELHIDCPLVKESDYRCPNCMKNGEPEDRYMLNDMPILYKRGNMYYCLECGQNYKHEISVQDAYYCLILAGFRACHDNNIEL